MFCKSRSYVNQDHLRILNLTLSIWLRATQFLRRAGFYRRVEKHSTGVCSTLVGSSPFLTKQIHVVQQLEVINFIAIISLYLFLQHRTYWEESRCLRFRAASSLRILSLSHLQYLTSSAVETLFSQFKYMLLVESWMLQTMLLHVLRVITVARYNHKVQSHEVSS